MKKKILVFLLAVSMIATPTVGQVLAPQVIAEAARSGHTVTMNAKVPKKGQTLKVVLTNVHVKNMFEENDWGIADIVPASHVKR